MRANRRKWIVAIVILLLAGRVVWWFIAVDRELTEICCISDQFFDAIIHKDFDEFDRIMTEDTWFANQGKSYGELRDLIRENFETVYYFARKGEMSSRTRYSYSPGHVTTVEFHIKIAEDCNGEKKTLYGSILIKRTDDGAYKVIDVFCSSRGDDDEQGEFAESLFGETNFIPDPQYRK